MSDMVKIEVNGTAVECPVIKGSEGEVAIDISKLRAQTKAITLDIGFVNTGSCESGITFLNGEQGILRHRGYAIEDLAAHASFLEVSYLVMEGELPNNDQLQKMRSDLAKYSAPPEAIGAMIKHFPTNAHPMGVLSSAISALSGFNTDNIGADPDADQRYQMRMELMATIKAFAAWYYRHSKGQEALGSQPNLGYCEDFLSMMFGSEPDPIIANALDQLLILHVDHEQNCSASTVRLVGSSKANLYASVAAGVDALWGPLHGGANQKVLEMLEQIKNAGGDYKSFIEKAKDKSDPFKLMGFGHRVYKNFDPRAKIIKKSCDAVLSKLGVQDPLLDIAQGLEAEALKDPYFVERKLFPNVDFYSGIIYRALGIPTDMFTVMFAIGRLPGWMGQWEEMRTTPGYKIGRPRQVYTGPTARNFKPMDQR